MLQKAIAVALDAHGSQTDLAGKPYLYHLLRIAMKHQDNEILFSIAMLHDVVEDTFGKPNQITLENIYSEFGTLIGEAVNSITRREAGMRHPSITGVFCYTSRESESYRAYIERCGQNALARIIKIDDLTDNLNPHRRMPVLTSKDRDRIKRYNDALNYLGTL